ncbi:MAG: glycoside hydrolase family 130 protein [Phycisphaerae bacterium]|nr:glycoside hydrolase family 130 protein [Phycisphaerae bacterium]
MTGDDFPEPIHSVYNSGITKYRGRYVMVCRAEDRALRQHLWLARSDDGVHFVPDPKPFELPADPVYRNGIRGSYFDPRVTRIGDEYYIVHAAADAEFNPRLAMIRTTDFETFEFVSFPGSVNTRNGILFPETIGGRYALMERDGGPSGGEMWVTYSPDLVYWGQAEKLHSRTAEYWHYNKIGGGAVPIRTDRGWLILYHGVHTMCSFKKVYKLGVLLSELENPARVISWCPYAVLEPEELYEKTGMSDNTVFTAGAWVEDNGRVKVYYGAGDAVQCLATTTVDDLLEACFLEPLETL